MNLDWLDILRKDGISQIECPFSEDTLNKWNQLLDPHFKSLKDQERSYATIVDLHKMGILEQFFSDELRSIIQNIMPDPTLISFHAYEIKGMNQKNHVFGDALNGWHRDIANLPGLKVNDLNFVSLFIYLSGVKEGDGEFEIIQRSFDGPALDGDRSLKILGPTGTTFLWNRTLLHRACPNLSPQRRRVLKISFQHNYLQNEYINSDAYLKTRELVRDPYLKFLLGEKHQISPYGHSAPHSTDLISKAVPLFSNSQVKLRLTEFIKGLWWFVRRNKRPFGP
ncbi:MAG: hypothetical protein WC635_04810 [Bacteriovorax sp.]